MGLFRTLRRGATWISLGVAGGALVVTARHLLETPQPLTSALPGDGRIDRKHGGDIYYNLAGPAGAEPLVLLHDFYPGASNFEFRRVFPALAERYSVYAPDWLGFGMSEHPSVAYTGEFYSSVLTGFLRDVVERPATVVAHGLAANVAVRAASDNPDVFSRLILVAPDVMAGVTREPTVAQTLVRATRRVSLGIVPYALLSTRPALRWVASSRSMRAEEGVPSDEEMDHLYASAHQFGGQHALLAALTGDLDLAIPNAFALLEPPVLVISGERDRKHPRVDMEDIAVLNPHADLDVIPNASDVVFADQPEAFVAAVERWLETPATRHAIDESALLYPPTTGGPVKTAQKQSSIASGAAAPSRENGSVAESDSLVAESRGGTVMSGAEEERPPAMPTDEAATQPGTGGASAAPETPETPFDEGEALTGTPGSVTPGVSDAGQEGPATADVAGISTLEEPTVTLDTPGPAFGEASTASAASGPTDLIPEAGTTQSEDTAPRPTSAGSQADADLAPNIADTGESASETPNAASQPTVDAEATGPQPPRVTRATAGKSNAELAGPGDVAGLTEIVQTPDTVVSTSAGVETPDTVATPDSVQTPASGAEPVVPTSEDTPAAEPVEPAAEPKRPASPSRAQSAQSAQSARRSASEPTPRAQPRGQSTRGGHSAHSGHSGKSGEGHGSTRKSRTRKTGK